MSISNKNADKQKFTADIIGAEILKDGDVNYLTYKNSKLTFGYIHYSRNLGYMLKSKVFLEVLFPKDMASCTCRLAQALCYKRKFLTNSMNITKEDYYNENDFCQFDEPENIDLKFFDKEKNFNDCEEPTALRLLDYMKNRLFN